MGPGASGGRCAARRRTRGAVERIGIRFDLRRRPYLSRMPSRPLILIIICSVATAAWCGDERTALRGAPAGANACGDSAVISWEPAAPRQGALFQVRVSGIPAGTALSGTVSGEALHFAPVPESQGDESLAGVPIEAGDSLGVHVYCSVGRRTDTLRASLAL